MKILRHVLGYEGIIMTPQKIIIIKMRVVKTESDLIIRML